MAVTSSRIVFLALREISKSKTPMSAAEIAAILAVPTTTAVRAVNTLEAAGYAVRTSGAARYVLGKSGQRLAYAFMAQFPIRDLALPYLQQLTLVSGYGSSLFIRLGWYAVRIALISGTTSIVNAAPIGVAGPLTTGAAALAMLAQLPENGFDRALERNSEVNRVRLGDTCKRIRIQGYAFQTSILEGGGHDLAFPLSDPARSILASVALEGFVLGAEEIHRLVDLTRTVVQPLQDIMVNGSSNLDLHYEHIDPDSIILN